MHYNPECQRIKAQTSETSKKIAIFFLVNLLKENVWHSILLTNPLNSMYHSCRLSTTISEWGCIHRFLAWSVYSGDIKWNYYLPTISDPTAKFSMYYNSIMHIQYASTHCFPVPVPQSLSILPWIKERVCTPGRSLAWLLLVKPAAIKQLCLFQTVLFRETTAVISCNGITRLW